MIAHQIHAGIVQTQRSRCALGQRGKFAVPFSRCTARASGHIIDPTLAVTLHRGDRMATDHEHAPIVPTLFARVDKALQIGHTLIGLHVRERHSCREALQTLALGAEQWLHDQFVLRCRFFHEQSSRHGALFRRPGQWRRNSGSMQEETGHRLIDTFFDSAGVVIDRHAEFPQRMQQA